MKKIFLILAASLCSLCSLSQSQEQSARIQDIKDKGDKYFYGESTSNISYAEAYEAAISDIARQINASVDISIQESEGVYDSQTMIRSAAVFSNINKIEFQRTDNDATAFTTFAYISKAQYMKQLNAAEANARDRIQTFIEEGKYQEGKVNIADALRNFYWALQLAKKYKFQDRLGVTDNRNMQLWLDDKIKSILQNIEVSLAQEDVVYDPKEYDHYIVNLKVKYADRDVSNLDIMYFNGEENYRVTAKNGQGTLRYPSLSGKKDVSFRIKYRYDDPDEVEEDVAYTLRTTQNSSYDDYNTKKVPVKVNKEQTIIKENGDQEKINYAIAEMSAGIPAQVEELYDEETRIYLDGEKEANDLLKVSTSLEAALRSRDYQSVYDCFSPEALSKFKMMTNTGTISVISNPSYTFESTAHYIRCGFIPVSVKNGKHSRNENIVLRFDPQTRKISSIGYALTENAENDIFRSADWKMESRYAILKFMEDYQTAYTTKDAEYISSIFNGDAIIITGTVQDKKAGKSYMKEMESNQGPIVTNGVTYTKYTKGDYIERMKNIFHNNAYIYLKYHDAVLSKAATPPMLSEAFWIQLKQDFNSSSYNDKGYLTLQVGMKPSGAQIYVRTWTPNQVPLSEMKKLFRFSDN